MPKKGQRTAKIWPGDTGDVTGFVALCAAYFEALRVQNYSEKTIESREHHLREFVKWAHERSLARPSEVTKPILERYQRHQHSFSDFTAPSGRSSSRSLRGLHLT